MAYDDKLLEHQFEKSQGNLLQKDPVCGMVVDEKKTKLTSEHDNKTFYFCSAACKASFDKDPHEHGHK